MARRYSRIRYRLLLANIAVSLLILASMQWSGFSHTVAHFWSRLFASRYLVILGYLLVFGAVYYVLMLPLRFYGDFLTEHRFGLSNLSLKGWLVRETKQLWVSAVICLLLIEGLYALLLYVPVGWPLFACLSWVGFSVVLARIFPTVLLPIFYKTAPLGDEELARRLLDLCQRVGVRAVGVFRVALSVDTRKANAALAGLARTRRVLVSDTLLERFSPEEIETVLAHELGHHRHRHISKLLVLSGVGSFVAFSILDGASRLWISPLGLQSLSDIAGFPVMIFALSLIGLVFLPVQNALSRYFEAQADRFAVLAARFPKAFASALRKLSELNLADPNPPRWVELLFYDHPPIARRIESAEAKT